MATTIKLKNGSGAPLAGDLVAGEPALDLTNKRLYTEDSGGTVIEVGTNPTSLTTGTVTSDKAIVGYSRTAGTGGIVLYDDDQAENRLTLSTGGGTGINAAINQSGGSFNITDASLNVVAAFNDSGNVGIGTTSPSAPLQVQGSAGEIRIQRPTASQSDYSIKLPSSSGEFQVFDNNNSSARLTIDSSGNVGIGTASPQELLHLRKDASAVVAVKAQNNTTNGIMEYQAGNDADNWFFGIDASDNFGISDVTGQASQRLVITQAGNVGIGTASPSTFNAAQCNNLVVGTGSGAEGITVYSGTTSQGGLAFADGTSTNDQYRGLIQYDHNNNSMLFWANTSERMRIDSSGNVGIGTSSPSELLHIAESTGTSTLRSQNDSGSFYFGIDNSTGGTFSTGNYSRVLYSGGAYPMVFATNNAERMRIDSSGNVGIGTSSPAYRLDTQTSAATWAGRILNTNANGGGLLVRSDSTNNNNVLGAYGNGAYRMVVQADGNVGIGTTSPSGKLHVVGGPAYLFVSDSRGSQGTHYIGTNGTSGQNMFISANTGGISGGDMVFLNGGTERMRLDDSGNLLIGKTTTSLATAGIAFQPNGEVLVTRDSGITAYFNREGTDGDVIAIRNDNVTVGTISVSGSTTAYNTSSDQRLKENIVDAPAGNIGAIRVRSFDWKADGSHQTYGVVAQELVDVAPEAVSQGETEDDMWQVDYSKLVPMMIKEIQDLKAEVAALKGA